MRLLFAVKDIINEYSKDDVPGYAAQSCFYLLLSFFPFIMVLLSLVKYMPFELEALLNILNEVVPVYFQNDLANYVREVYASSTATLTSVSIIGTLWAAGRGCKALIKGLNAVYDIEETRNFIKVRLIATFYTAFFIISILASLILLVFGQHISNMLTAYIPASTAIFEGLFFKNQLFFILIMTLCFALMYKFIPSRKTRLFSDLPGAFVSALGWYLFSFFYALYVNHAPAYTSLYGSIGTAMFALIWLYACIIILYFGAEINAYLERHFKMHSIYMANVSAHKK